MQSVKRTNTVVLVLGAVIVIGFLAWAIFRTTSSSTSGGPVVVSTSTSAVTSTGVNASSTGTSGGLTNSPTGTPAKVESYANATHNFSISYPIELTAGAFENFHLLNSNDWRIGATAAKRGAPVIAIPVFRVDNQAKANKNYPRFYDVEVRVGVSSDVTQCYATDNGYTDQTVTNVTINGVVFKKFIFGDAAMMQYINGASYRTIHANKCYVIEQIRTGSSYRDEETVGGYSEADLDAFYAKTLPIVMSFRFTKK